MSDNSRIFQETGFDSGSFNEWLESAVRSTGMSREELLQQLIAAYWRQNELRSGATVLPNEESPSRVDRVSTLDEDQVSINADSKAAFDRPHDSQIQVNDLRERVEKLEEDSFDGEALQDLQRTINTHTKQISDLTDEHESLDEIDEAVTRALDLYESLSDSLHLLRDEYEELSADHNSLEENINEELTNLQTILEYLFETTTKNEASIKHLSTRYEQLAAERERLIELKEATIRLGIETATCESCGADIDLSTLASPICPQCNSTFSDIKQDSKWFGLTMSNTITTTKARDDPDRVDIANELEGPVDTDPNVDESDNDEFTQKGD